MKPLLLVVSSCLLVAACREPVALQPGKAAPAPASIEVNDALAQQAGLQSEPAVREGLARKIALPGEVVAVPDRTAHVSSATAGRLEQVSFNEGSVVKRGDVLAVLRVPDVGRLRGALAAAQARARAANTNADRLKALKASGLGAEQAVVDAEAEARAQDAEARALDEQLRALGAGGDVGGFLVPLRAPISGTVMKRDAVVGQPVDTEHVLATIVELSEVWFLARVYERDLSQLRVGARADVRLNAFADQHFDGSVDFISAQSDAVTRTLLARIKLANVDGRLRLGLFGSAHVSVSDSDAGQTQLIVPRSAVAEVNGRTVVFVKGSGTSWAAREVTLGASSLERVEVLRGLSEGERVATQGVFTLKSLLLKASLLEEE